MTIRRMAASLGIIALVLLVAPAIRGVEEGDGDCSVGVSWNNFQQPRWAATDAPNMEQTIVDGGGTFTDFDADLDTAQQLTDVETLINQGIDVLVLLPQDSSVVGPALEAAAEAESRSSPTTAWSRIRTCCTSRSTTSASAARRRKASSRSCPQATTS